MRVVMGERRRMKKEPVDAESSLTYSFMLRSSLIFQAIREIGKITCHQSYGNNKYNFYTEDGSFQNLLTINDANGDKFC